MDGVEKKKGVVCEDSCSLLAEWMSLSSHYQTLSARCVLRDTQMLQTLECLNQTRQKCKAAEVETDKSQAKLAAAERENKSRHGEDEKVRDQFRASEERVAALLVSLEAAKAENAEYKRRQESIRNAIKKENGGVIEKISMRLMPLLSSDEKENLSRAESPSSNFGRNSTPTENNNTNADIDFDQTGDSNGGQLADACEAVELRRERVYMRRSKALGQEKRRSASQQPPKKRSAHAMVQMAHIEEVEAIYEEGNEDACPTPSKRSRDDKRETRVKKSSAREFRRSVSESRMLVEAKIAATTPQRAPRGGAATSHTDMNWWTKGLPIVECDHKFISFSSLFGVMGSCCSCFSSLGIRALRCENCKLCVHDKCVATAPMPCIPSAKVPPKQKQRPRLLDYCPDSQPKIPPLIVRCVYALENRHLNAVGIYRLSGNEREVKALLEGFNSSNYPPNLNNRDHETITSCMKEFLKGLREPLLPISSYNEFAKAAESKYADELMNLVTELPVPNRDTLAYLCAHWQKVASNCNINQMPIENLAKYLGPTVVGSSLTKTASVRLKDHKLIEESQIGVLLQLLRLDMNFWRNFFDPPTGGAPHTPHQQQQRITTPKTAPAVPRHNREFKADRAFLGPVTKSPSKGLLLQPITRTPGRPTFNRRC